MESLEKLLPSCTHKNIVVVGAGPSLDFCMPEIADLASDDTLFLLTDIVSENFIKVFPHSQRLVFTVESRRHNYLSALVNERIAVYSKAQKKNYKNYKEAQNRCYGFHFDMDVLEPDQHEKSFAMKSPGTVAGAAIYWALAVSALNSGKPRIILFGIDLSYIDNQVYNRLCKFSFTQNYWHNRESREWVAILQRTSEIEFKEGYVIRSSREFSLTKEKLGILLAGFANTRLLDYSPMGISAEYVKKTIPGKIILQ